jgi:sporulation protein YunB
VDTINKAVTNELKKDNVSYNDLVTVERNESGEVLAITTNMVKMNELKASVISSVQEQLSDNHKDIGVPLGTLLGNDLLHGRGPNVPLRLTLSGNVNADFKSSFESAGINQTKHQIYLNIHTSVYSFIPGFNTTTDVETNIPVAETIIVGEVPQVVANLK